MTLIETLTALALSSVVSWMVWTVYIRTARVSHQLEQRLSRNEPNTLVKPVPGVGPMEIKPRR